MHYISILDSFSDRYECFFQEELKLHYNGEMHCSGVQYIGLGLNSAQIITNHVQIILKKLCAL